MNPQATRVSERIFTGQHFLLRVAYLSHPGRARVSNEDHVALPSLDLPHGNASHGRGHLFLVADGVGGQSAGEVASRIATQSAMSAYYTAPQGRPDRDALIAAFRFAHEQVRSASGQAAQKGMATTLVGLAVCGTTAIVANVGDSRAYVWRDGEMQQVTRDHSLVAELMRQGTISPDLAKTHPHRHVITQSIGGDTEIAPDVYEIPLKGNERLLLCTDGLTDVVDVQTMADILRQPSLSGAARDLVRAALAAGGPDNVTVLLVEPTRVVPVPRKKTVLGHPAAFALFLGLGLALVFAILYVVARLVLSPSPIRASSLTLPGPAICNQGFLDSEPATYLEASVSQVMLWQGDNLRVDIATTSRSAVLLVPKSSVKDAKFEPTQGDLLTAVAALEQVEPIGDGVAGTPLRVYWRALEVDVQRMRPIPTWGTWVLNEQDLKKYPYVHAKTIDSTWRAGGQSVKELNLKPPLLLKGTWALRPVALFDVTRIYEFDEVNRCYRLAWPLDNRTTSEPRLAKVGIWW